MRHFLKKQVIGQQKNFLRLWIGQSISLLGSQVTTLVLPTLAIITLHADAFSVGLLMALQWFAFILLEPIAGTLADQLPKRQIMLIADFGRLLALGSIPLAFALGERTIVHLYIVAGVMSVFTVFFDIAYQSYLPVLLDYRDLMDGNAKLTLSEGAAQIGGPALGGVLIPVVGAAYALTANAISYLFSLIFLLSIHDQEKGHKIQLNYFYKKFFEDLREGIRTVFHNPILRTITFVNTAQNTGASLAEAVILVFAYRMLHLSPEAVGIATAIGSIGFIIGAVIASPISCKTGIGWMLVLSSVAGICAYSILPLGLLVLPAFIIFLWRFLLGLHIPTYDIHQISLRQAITPIQLQGRMNATIRTISWGAYGIAPIVGRFLGTKIGLVPTISLGAVIYLVGSLPLLTNIIRNVKHFNDIENQGENFRF
jgi:MFS family permease